MHLPKMRDLKKEVFKVILLNSQNQVIDIVIAHEGTVTMSNVYVREIINLANKFGAAAMIFAHNHPSGEPRPSNEDKEITEELVFAGRIMRIKVLDHIIIGEISAVLTFIFNCLILCLLCRYHLFYNML